MINNGYFMTFWLYIWNNLIKNSLTYKALCGLYSFISSQWQNSWIAGLFRRTFISKDAARNSLWGKVFFLPFIILEKLQSKYAERINTAKERSLVIKFFKYMLHNFLAVNLRFIGIFIAVAAGADFIISVFRGGNLLLSLIAIALGVALSFFDFNVTGILKDSWLLNLAAKCLDTEFSFNFFYVTKCGGKARLACAAFFGLLTGTICGLTSPVLAFLFVAALLFVSTVLYKVEFGVLITVFLAPIVPTMAVVGLTLLCLLSLLVKALTTKKFTWRLDGMGLMVLLMLFVYAVATLLSFAPMKGVQILAVYTAFMAFYFIIINTIRTKKQFFSLLKIFVLSGTLVCLYGILQYLFGWNVTQAWTDENMFSDIKMRIYSTLENPNVLGEYILLVLPASIALMWTSKKLLPRLVYALLSLVLGLALILTFSRGCWLGIMASASVFITFASGKLWGLALIALPFVPALLPESIINRFTSIGNMSDSSTSYRVSIWLGTLMMLKDFWMSGVGLGPDAFNQVYPFYAHNMVVAQHAHNLFLHITSETGIVGISVFVFLILLFFKRMISGFGFLGKDNCLSVVILATGSAVVGFLLQGMFDNSFYNYRVFMIFWSVIAMGITACNLAEAESAEREDRKNV